MTKRDKKIGAGVLAVILIGTAVVAWNRRPENNANFPEGTYWICSDPKCNTEFSLTMKELGEHHQKHYGQPPACPKCKNTETFRADRCPNCSRIYPMQRDIPICPHCKKPTTPRAT